MKLNLSGELIPSDWAAMYREFGYTSGFYCAADIRQAVADLPDGEDLVLEINSIGGDVLGANEIYALLESCTHPTKAIVQSMAASAASYFIMACDHIAMHLPAQLMIHRASTCALGNRQDLEQAQQMLDTTDNAILDVYCRKCGDKASREALAEMMANETYINATDALNLGLIDSIVGAEDDAPTSGLLVASVFSNTVRAMRTLPDIQTLIQTKNAEVDRLRQELEAEKMKFD